MNSKMRPTLTVAVCTRNRAELLKECLDSVVSQIDSAKNVEVLVVDNGSTDGTAETCKAFEGRGFLFKYAFEPQPGLSHARNRAIAEANGEAIAFLDDDAVVCDGWLDVALENWKSGKYAAFGGPYDAWHRYGPAPEWFDDKWESFLPDWANGPLERDLFPRGGNCVISLEWCRKMGGFDAGLGMRGNKVAYGEESDLFKRMQDDGAVLGWVNELLIHHCVRPDKYGFFWRVKSSVCRGRDCLLVLLPEFRLRIFARHAAKCCLLCADFAVRFALSRFAKNRRHWKHELLDLGQPVLFECGKAVGLLRLLFSPRRDAGKRSPAESAPRE